MIFKTKWKATWNPPKYKCIYLRFRTFFIFSGVGPPPRLRTSPQLLGFITPSLIYLCRDINMDVHMYICKYKVSMLIALYYNMAYRLIILQILFYYREVHKKGLLIVHYYCSLTIIYLFYAQNQLSEHFSRNQLYLFIHYVQYVQIYGILTAEPTVHMITKGNYETKWYSPSSPLLLWLLWKKSLRW